MFDRELFLVNKAAMINSIKGVGYRMGKSHAGDDIRAFDDPDLETAVNIGFNVFKEEYADKFVDGFEAGFNWRVQENLKNLERYKNNKSIPRVITFFNNKEKD